VDERDDGISMTATGDDAGEEEMRETSIFQRVDIDASGAMEKSMQELTAMLEGVTFDAYILRFSNLNRKGVLKRRTSISKLITWKHDLIKTSLLKLPSAVEKDALQMFRNVTGFMGDRPSSKGEYDHACKILHTVLGKAAASGNRGGDKSGIPSLADETYVQICKQVSGNPSPASTLLGWELMMVCLSSFPPSEDLKPHLMAFCANTVKVEAHNTDPRVPHYAEVCLRNCQRSVERGPIALSEVPGEDAMMAIRQGVLP
jgi:hypothetical protein